MASDWNPRRVLAVDPSSVAVNQCVGTTLQGLRCKNPVSWKVNDDLAQAGRILDALPDVRWCQSHTAAVLRDLERVAYFTLCRHRHRHDQAQVDNIANRWLNKIRRLPTRSAHADSRSTSMASSTSTRPSRSSASSHTLVGRSQSIPSPPLTPSTSYTSHDTRRYKNGNIDITNIIAMQSSLGRRNPSITVRNIIIDPPISARGSSRSTSRTLSSSSTSTSSSSSSHSSHRSPSIPLTISETDISDDDTPDTSSDNSSDDSSPEEEEEDEGDDDDDIDDDDDDDDYYDDGTTTNLHVQKQRLERMLAELEAQIRESRRSSSTSTPATTAARSSHRRSNAPSLSSNRTDTPSSSRTERPYVRVKDGVVQRRPIKSDTTCYICLESIKSEREATWCRSSCGNNVHYDCFYEWEDTQGDVVRCAFCRSRWTYPSRS